MNWLCQLKSPDFFYGCDKQPGPELLAYIKKIGKNVSIKK